MSRGLWDLVLVSLVLCPQLTWARYEQHFHLQVRSEGSLIDHSVADVVIWQDKPCHADVPMFPLVSAYSHEVQSRVHIDPAIGVLEGVLQLFFISKMYFSR